MKAQPFIKTLVIVAVGTFHFAVVPRRTRLYRFMLYSMQPAKLVELVLFVVFRFAGVRKLGAVIRLNEFRAVAKISDCTLYKVNGTCGA